MRVLALVPGLYDISPSQRYRIEQWEPLLRERGVEITYEPFECPELNALLYQPGQMARKMTLVAEGFGRRFSVVKRAKDFDLVYILREAALLGPPVFERMVHRTGVPIVFDFDDAIFVSYRSPSNGYLSYLKFASKTRTTCRLASHVMVGNPYLAEYARQVNDHVTVIPTTIDTQRYHVPPPKNSNGPLVIGWTGSHSTVQHLDTLRGALKKLASRERFTWRARTEVDDLAPIDIGVMPLPEDKWSKGKCGAKALQFMGMGIPTVCSPVGVNKEIIQDDENGFLASTEDEWVDKLSRLLRSAELRRRLGQAGRSTVEQKYSAISQAPRVYEIFESVIRGHKR